MVRSLSEGREDLLFPDTTEVASVSVCSVGDSSRDAGRDEGLDEA